MIAQTFLSYAAGIAAIGLLAGGSIGYVLRGARARRQASTLKDEIVQLRDKLASASHQPVDTERTATPQRWTGTEVAAVLGAIGTLVGVIGAFYNNYQGNTLKQLKADLAHSEEQRLALAGKTTSLIGDLDAWSHLTPFNPSTQARRKPQDVDVDFKKITGDCNSSKFKLSFGGSGPSVLHCNSGSVLIALNKPSTLLLIPEGKGQ